MSHLSQRPRSLRLRRHRFVPRLENLEGRESPTVLLQPDSWLANEAGRAAANPPPPSVLETASRLKPAAEAEGSLQSWLTQPTPAPVESTTSSANEAFASAEIEWTASSPTTDDPFAPRPWATPYQPRRLPFLSGTGLESGPGAGWAPEATSAPGHGATSAATTMSARPTMTESDLLWLSAALQSAEAATSQGGRSDPGTPPVYGGFTESIYLRDTTNLSQTSGMGWAPDGSNRLFIIRKTGQVRIVYDGYLLPTPFATITPIFTASECGLIGMTFDPNYTINRYVYFFVTVSSSEQQIIRYTDDGNVGIDKTTILGGLPTRGANHDGGALAFGFDGKLYFAIGDLGNGTGVNEDLTTLASKVGRTNTDGSVPLDNPFYDGPGPNNDYIWAIGFRNPYTMTFQPGTGQLWVNVVGTSYEQVMLVDAGAHGGWNRYENNQPEGFIQPIIKYRTNGFDQRNLTATGAARQGDIATFTTTVNHGFRRGEYITVAGVGDASFNGRFPVLDVPSATTFRVAQPGPDATSGGGTARTDIYGGAILGGTFYNGTQFPEGYWGNYFFGDYNSGNFYRSYVDDQNNIHVVDLFANGLGSYIDVETGPDGALYYVNFGGTIFRMTYNVTEQNLVLSHRNVNLIEGNVAAFSVSLAQAPTEPVTVNVANIYGDPDIYVVGGDTLTFTPDNWFAPQAAYLYAGEDDDSDYDAALLEVSAPGLPSQYVGVFAADNDPGNDSAPRAQISQPWDGDEVSGTGSEFFGNGYDDRGTIYAEFYVDDVLEWVDPLNPGDPDHYHYGGGHLAWDTTRYSNGPHRLKLVVYDAALQTGSMEITVTVNNP